MRLFRRLLLIGLVAGLVALFATNPSMDEFEAFAADHLRGALEAQVAARTGNSALGRLLAGTGARVASQYLDRVSTRENYVVASVYRVDLDGAASDDLQWTFLGAGGHFIPLSGPRPGESGRTSPSEGASP